MRIHPQRRPGPDGPGPASLAAGLLLASPGPAGLAPAALAVGLLLASAGCVPALLAPGEAPDGAVPSRLRAEAPSTPFEEAVLGDVEDGTLERYDLLDVALAASSASAEERTAARGRWEAFLARITPAIAAERTDAGKGKRLLGSLHREILSGYEANQNDLRVLIQEGRYNCVSSAVAYVVAAQHFGLSASGMILPSHAYARVVASGKELEVETTTPGGFDPDRNNPAFRQHLATVAPSEPGGERDYRLPVDALTLISFLYMNRGAVAAGDDRLGEAVAYLERARRVATDDTRARIYRDSALASVSGRRIKAGDLAGGIELIETALTPPAPGGRTGEVLRKNLLVATERASQAGDFALAARGLAVARKSDLPAALVRQTEGFVEMYRGISESQAGRHEEAGAAAERALSATGRDKVAVDNFLFVYQRWIHARLDASDFTGAVKTGRAAVALLPGDEGAAGLLAFALAKTGGSKVERDPAGAEAAYAEARKLDPGNPSIRRNLAVAISRQAGKLYDARDYAGAIREWERALVVEPGLPDAKGNIELARKAGRR